MPGPFEELLRRAGRRGREAARHREVVGLVAAVVAFVAIATTFAFQTPPFLAPDEIAHLGYAQEVAGFELPTIETVPHIPESATLWQAESDSRADDRYRQVWVANHPPLNYVAVAPLMWLADATHRSDGGLMYLRFANIAFAAIGIVFTYLFALESTGGARRVALAAASLTAFVPQGHGLFSEALNDGLGFAAGGALLWAGSRCVRRGPNTRNLVLLGGAATIGWGARASTMLMSIVVVGFVAVVTAVKADRFERLRTVSTTAALGLGPAAAAFGWFYVRNIHLYGDFGGSAELLDRFHRSTKGGLFEVMTWGHRWVDLYHRLFSPSPLFSIKAPPGINPATIIAVVGLVIALVSGTTGDRTERKAPWIVLRSTALLAFVAALLIVLTVARHISGGGSAYARYLFPALPVLATFAAIGFDRLVPRLLPAVAVGALGFWAWRNVPTSVDLQSVRRPRDRGRGMPDVLRVLPSSASARDVVLWLGVIGTTALAVVVIAGLVDVVRHRRALFVGGFRRSSSAD